VAVETGVAERKVVHGHRVSNVIVVSQGGANKVGRTAKMIADFRDVR
jgi:hypothetical protein